VREPGLVNTLSKDGFSDKKGRQSRQARSQSRRGAQSQPVPQRVLAHESELIQSPPPAPSPLPAAFGQKIKSPPFVKNRCPSLFAQEAESNCEEG
jgi:hypothetical protein